MYNTVDETHRLDYDGNRRHVPHTVPLGGLDILDDFHDFHAFDDFTENGIAELPRFYAFVIEVAIVPFLFLTRFRASFLMGSLVFFCCNPGVREPPWIIVPFFTRWKIVPW